MSQLDFAKQIVRSTHRISKQSGFDDLAAISALRDGRVVTAAEIAEVVKKRITNLPQAHRDVVEYLQEKTQDE